MVFITLLLLVDLALAGVAAYFSVWGLAQLFTGIFWSVVAMGTVIEIGKLMAISYLYRYWKVTSLPLKTYMILGVLCTMILTSTGIFGKLSAGYQTDMLPLKQITQQVDSLSAEKDRLIERKHQIDLQIAQLPPNVVKGRTQLMSSFKEEQRADTKRISELDSKILDIKTSQIQAEAHIGPITYIAKAFGLDTDNATKYLIYIILFCFDPMAVALTLGVNNALEQEEKKKRKLNTDQQPQVTGSPSPPDAEDPYVSPYYFPAHPIEPGHLTSNEPLLQNPDIENPLRDEREDPEIFPALPIKDYKEADDNIPELMPEVQLSDSSPTEIAPAPVVQQPSSLIPSRRARAYPHNIGNMKPDDQKMMELLDFYRPLKQKVDNGEELTQDEKWEMQGIYNLLSNSTFSVYL